MKKNILLLLFISLLHTTCVWGMDNKTDQHKKITVKQFSNPFVNEEFVCIAILVFFPLKPLLVLRLTCKRLSNYVAKFTHKHRSIKVREPAITSLGDYNQMEEKRQHLREIVKESKLKIELSLQVNCPNEEQLKRIYKISKHLYKLNIADGSLMGRETSYIYININIRCFPEISYIYIYVNTIVDAIKKCTNLKILCIQDLPITQKQTLEILQIITGLQDLIIPDCNITNLTELPFPKTLKLLILPSFTLMSENIKKTRQNIKHLEKSCTNLKELRLRSNQLFENPETEGTKEIVDSLITFIFDTLPYLKRLGLDSPFSSHCATDDHIAARNNMVSKFRKHLPDTLTADPVPRLIAISIQRKDPNQQL